MRDYFMKSQRLGFSVWRITDYSIAALLWKDASVTRYLCASGVLTDSDIAARLMLEINNDKTHLVQYWPIFELSTDELVGCCGLRPFGMEKDVYEFGVHLRKKFWGEGFAHEASCMVLDYGFNMLKAKKIYAGHHPENTASKKLIKKLGFTYIGDRLYLPTGLFHPSYEMVKLNTKWQV